MDAKEPMKKMVVLPRVLVLLYLKPNLSDLLHAACAYSCEASCEK